MLYNEHNFQKWTLDCMSTSMVNNNTVQLSPIGIEKKNTENSDTVSNANPIRHIYIRSHLRWRQGYRRMISQLWPGVAIITFPTASPANMWVYHNSPALQHHAQSQRLRLTEQPGLNIKTGLSPAPSCISHLSSGTESYAKMCWAELGDTYISSVLFSLYNSFVSREDITLMDWLPI